MFGNNNIEFVYGITPLYSYSIPCKGYQLNTGIKYNFQLKIDFEPAVLL